MTDVQQTHAGPHGLRTDTPGRNELIVIGGNDGRPIKLGSKPLGSGTYGVVYGVSDDPGAAAKIYRTKGVNKTAPQQMRQAEKLDQMAAAGEPETPEDVRVGWPTETVWMEGEREQPDGCAHYGYLMPRAPKGTISIAYLVRKHAASPRAIRAAELLQTAAEALHDQGYVIGDVNGNNFAISPDDELWIFDVDGWQLKTPDGRLHYAQGSTDYYTPAEILNRIGGTLPNCVSPLCPLAGRTHRPTPSCRPREPRHDRHGIRILTRELTQDRRSR